MKRVPAQPLIELVRTTGINIAAQPAHVQRAYHRAKQTGQLTARAADTLAITLFKLHPAEIWPTWATSPTRRST